MKNISEIGGSFNNWNFQTQEVLKISISFFFIFLYPCFLLMEKIYGRTALFSIGGVNQERAILFCLTGASCINMILSRKNRLWTLFMMWLIIFGILLSLAPFYILLAFPS